MADQSEFPAGTQFSTTVQLDADGEIAYGHVTIALDPGEYPDLHTLDVADLADAVRDVLVAQGYTVDQFTATKTAIVPLDWPTEEG